MLLPVEVPQPQMDGSLRVQEAGTADGAGLYQPSLQRAAEEEDIGEANPTVHLH